jgi:hypothetical protein
MVISPELADVLSTIVARIRGDRPDVPLVVSYDQNERVYHPPMPLLFQWRRRLDHRAVSETVLRTYLDHALTEISSKTPPAKRCATPSTTSDGLSLLSLSSRVAIGALRVCRGQAPGLPSSLPDRGTRGSGVKAGRRPSRSDAK